MKCKWFQSKVLIDTSRQKKAAEEEREKNQSNYIQSRPCTVQQCTVYTCREENQIPLANEMACVHSFNECFLIFIFFPTIICRVKLNRNSLVENYLFSFSHTHTHIAYKTSSCEVFRLIHAYMNVECINASFRSKLNL